MSSFDILNCVTYGDVWIGLVKIKQSDNYATLLMMHLTEDTDI